MLQPCLTLRVFSNWLLMRVIMPSAAMKDSRDSTCTSNVAEMYQTNREPANRLLPSSAST